MSVVSSAVLLTVAPSAMEDKQAASINNRTNLGSKKRRMETLVPLRVGWPECVIAAGLLMHHIRFADERAADVVVGRT